MDLSKTSWTRPKQFVPVQQGINPYLPTVLLSIAFNKLPLIAEGHEIDPDHQGDTHSQPLLPSSSQSDRLDEDISSDDDAGANNAGYMRRKTKNHRSSAGKGMGFFRFIIIKQLKVRKSQNSKLCTFFSYRPKKDGNNSVLVARAALRKHFISFLEEMRTR